MFCLYIKINSIWKEGQYQKWVYLYYLRYY